MRQEAPQIPDRPLEVLFVMRNLDGYLRYFASALELLVDRGHSVTLLLQRGGHTGVDQAWLDRMTQHSNFEHEVADHFAGSRWHAPSREIRRSLEYVRHLRPEFAALDAHRWRSQRRSSSFIKWLTALPVLGGARRIALFERLLTVLDRATPRPPEVARYLERLQPDLVALCDYGHAGSLYSVYVETARAQGIPTAMCVASWDNLSTRQLIRATPDALLVWNSQQVEEAVGIHGIPAERVLVTGAQCFDHWFTWQSRPRQSFADRVGLDGRSPFVLWVGGALNPSERSEPEFVRDWLTALRSSSYPAVRDLGVLLRPHPKRLWQWLDVDYSRFSNVSVWPRNEMTMPTDAAQRADYYDSISHSAAVVGINSSAMIEAAIIGRPVIGILADEFRNSHVGTIHFSYVLESEGGIVRTADTFDEHFALLDAVLGRRDLDVQARSERFVSRFVRPLGLDRSATPIFVDTLEQVASLGVRRESTPWWIVPARGAVAAAIVGGTRIRGARRLARRVSRGVWRRARWRCEWLYYGIKVRVRPSSRHPS